MNVNSVGLVQLNTLLRASSGSSDVAVGLIDGPVDVSHPAFGHTNIKIVSTNVGAACQSQGSPACVHGTFVAGLLAGAGAAGIGICPQSPLCVRPIFCEAPDLEQCPAVTPHDLAEALQETVNSGVKVINLSVGLGNSAVERHAVLNDAVGFAFRKGVIVVAAAGNHGRIGHVPLFDHPWIIPVGACDERGEVVGKSNLGPSLGKRGILAPGTNVTSTAPGGGYTTMSGTSVAAPFVSGTIALLWSVYPHASAEQIRTAILRPGYPRKSIIPPLLNAEASRRALAGGKMQPGS